MNEETTAQKEAQRRPGSVQRAAEGAEREVIKQTLRQKIKAVREGHATGGYCDTAELHRWEKQLHAVIATQVEETANRQDASALAERKSLLAEVAGFSWKPKLVVDPNQ